MRNEVGKSEVVQMVGYRGGDVYLYQDGNRYIGKPNNAERYQKFSILLIGFAV